MDSNVADRAEDTVQVLIRFAPWTTRPLSPLQSLWKGPPPEGVTKILMREALHPGYREGYAKWASSFALLSNPFLTRVFEQELKRAKQLARDEWQSFPWVDCHCCKVGDNYLWVQKQDHGCTIELCYPDTDPDVRILTIENMPVLCSDASGAARLAMACYPTPPANLVWHSYW